MEDSMEDFVAVPDFFASQIAGFWYKTVIRSCTR